MTERDHVSVRMRTVTHPDGCREVSDHRHEQDIQEGGVEVALGHAAVITMEHAWDRASALLSLAYAVNLAWDDESEDDPALKAATAAFRRAAFECIKASKRRKQRIRDIS